VHAREAFRHHSFVSPIAKAVLAGFGSHGYHLALEHFGQLLKGSTR
jgi:3-dehydroquinate dehydratase-2